MKKTIKAIFSIMLSLTIVISIAVVPAFAVPTGEDPAMLIIDNADLLTDEEEELLEADARVITEAYGCDVRVYTTLDMEGMNADEYAQEVYVENGFGYDEDQSGVMLMISMEERTFCILAKGYGNVAFTDYGKEMLEGEFIDDLSGGYYYDSFYSYIDACNYFLMMANDGTPIDVDNKGYYESDYSESSGLSAEEILIRIAIVIFGPLIIAFIFCMINLRKMKSAREERVADKYISVEGLNLTKKEDIFLNRSVTRVKIEKDSDSGGTSVNSDGFSSRSGSF